jgi:hypothetical protein
MRLNIIFQIMIILEKLVRYGGEALGQGLSCLTAQKQADIACEK